MLPHSGKWRRNDQKRQKRVVWTCSLSKDDDVGFTWSPASLEGGEIMVGLNSSMIARLDTNKEQTVRALEFRVHQRNRKKKSGRSFGSLCDNDTSK